MMQLGYGVTVLSRGLSQNSVDGIGTYTKELFNRLSIMESIEITPLSFNTPIPDELVSNEAITLGSFPKRALCSSVTSFPFLGSRHIRGKVDLVHATDHLIPKLRKTPVVATIMDAIPLSHPEWVSYSYRDLRNAIWRKSGQWAEHIITISEYSKSEIITHFGVAEDKITVIPLAVDKEWFSIIPSQKLAEVSKRLKLPEHFCVFVGTLQPRKNVRRVIEAHQALPTAVRAEFPLIIVGREGWSSDVVDGLRNGRYGDHVRWLQYLDRKDLHAVVSLATMLVFPSLYEGFGLPILEAMATNTPVITSNTTSLPDVAADAALLIDPLDVADISEAMLKVIEDGVLAGMLRAKGLARAQQFTWDETAKLTVEVYQNIVG